MLSLPWRSLPQFRGTEEHTNKFTREKIIFHGKVIYIQKSAWQPWLCCEKEGVHVGIGMVCVWEAKRYPEEKGRKHAQSLISCKSPWVRSGDSPCPLTGIYWT